MKAEEKREISEKECELCRPGGFHMTETLFSFIEEKTRELPLTVLDVGCGSGAAMEYLKERYPNWNISGMDPKVASEGEPEWLSGAVQRSCGEAEALPCPEHSVDVILMECSFSKTRDPKQALKEAIRVLKPNGWLLLSDMYARKEAVISEGAGLLGRLETSGAIFRRLKQAGFAVLEMQDRSDELIQWIGQKLMDGEGCELYQNLGVDRAVLKRAGCGYFICAAKPSGLWETLNYAVENSLFYQEKCGWMKEKPHFEAGDWSCFFCLPFSNADDIRENPDRFVCVNPKEIVRIITLRTSGSQGNPKRLFFTEPDLLWTADFFEKGMQYLIHPGERVTVYMEGPGRFSVGGLMKEGLARIGSEVTVHGLIRDLSAAVQDAEGRDCLIGVPSQMYALAMQAPQLRPNTVLLSADYVPDSILGFLETTWNCRVYTHWGMTETGYGGGVQCSAREGYHLRDEDLLLEVIDPKTGESVPDGEYGELVLTTLRRKGMPLIRYQTGDLGRMLTGRCGCGCLKPRLDKVMGRIEDVLLLSGEKVLSIQVLDELLFSIKGVQDFRAELWPADENRETGQTRPLLRIFVMGKSGSHPEDQARMLEEIQTCLETEFFDLLSIDVTEAELSPYIGSGKRKLEKRFLSSEPLP